uniref:Gigaxonin n=1 Tax=Equus asinus TaxID=9793 RepID=A0A9L0J779_EQUAS
MAEGSAVSDPQHAARLLRALSSFREESRFCDAHLVLDGEEIPVQKNILAAASPYIRCDVRRLALCSFHFRCSLVPKGEDPWPAVCFQLLLAVSCWWMA